MYQELLEKKSGELEKLQLQKETLEAAVEALQKEEKLPSGAGKPAAYNSPSVQARFQEEDFSETYGRVKQVFDVEADSLASQFKRQLLPEDPQNAKIRQTLEEMRELLSFEALYELSILPLSSQRQVLGQVFSGDGARLFEEWAGENPGGALEFSAWLKEQCELLSDVLVVRTPKGRAAGAADGTIWQEDASICEGVKLRYKNRLYDYSV